MVKTKTGRERDIYRETMWQIDKGRDKKRGEGERERKTDVTKKRREKDSLTAAVRHY